VTLFILLPAVVFAVVDNWEFVDAVYFAFITLSTIGFGDLVAGKDIKDDVSDAWKLVYEVFIIVWIVFGLGYILMVINLVTDAYKKSYQKAASALRPSDKQLISTVLREVLARRQNQAAPKGDSMDAVDNAVNLNDDVEAFIDEVEHINDATMTSFYQFITTAVRGTSYPDESRKDPNLLSVDFGRSQPCYAASAPGSRKVSTVTNSGDGTTGSNQEHYQTVSYGYTNKTFARRTEEALGSLQEERNNAEVGIQSANQVRPRSESSTLPIPDFLKDVTLEELLVAADNVRQRPSS